MGALALESPAPAPEAPVWFPVQGGKCPTALRASVMIRYPNGRIDGPMQAETVRWSAVADWRLAEDDDREALPVEPGIHFNLPDRRYFASGLGSTDLVTLCREPANWWYSSAHNPDRIDKPHRALDFGTALHALVLQGMDAFDRAVAVSPFPNFTTKDARAWRDQMVASGVAVLTEAEAVAVRQMAHLILNHPDTAAIGSGLRELAVVWEEDGLRFRARFDAILPAFSVDLKTYGGGNVQGRSPKDTAMRLIANRNYDVQRAHYHTAREKLIEAAREGRIFGDVGADDISRLAQITHRKSWAWVWLFYQRLDHASGDAPVVMPIAVEPEDPSHISGRRKIETALANYRSYVARFGLETPWAQINRLTWAEDTDFMPWMGDVAPPQEGE